MFYWITYIVSVLLVSSAMGYLVALCPCNTDMVVGFLFAIACYAVLAASIVFHYIKIARMDIGKAILNGLAFSIAGGIVVASLTETSLSEIVAPSYFMEWMMTGVTIGFFNALGMIVIPIFRKIKS